MTLDIIVPHYKEPWEVCKYLFNTIACQRGILFNNIRVIIVNDGIDEPEKPVFGIGAHENMRSFPFDVMYVEKEHAGVSAARNYGLDRSNADFVMFCDCDDGFLSNYALYMIFSAMQEGFDYCIANFIEETFDKDGNPQIINHDKDVTFMHGKIYRRQFLIDHNLRFDERMTLHEDGYFNNIVFSTANHEGTMKKISTPIYTWCWNKNSTVRKDSKDFVLRTYEDVMLTRDGICEELKKRGYDEDYENAVCMTVLNSFYDFQKGSYHKAENARYLKVAEKAFRRYWMKYKKVFLGCTNIKIAELARAARENACKNGMLFEQQDIKSFLKHIEHEVKP